MGREIKENIINQNSLYLIQNSDKEDLKDSLTCGILNKNTL